MTRKIAVLGLLVFTVITLAGCMTYDSYLRVDELKKEIALLTDQAAQKIKDAEKGDLALPEALEWVRYANTEIAKARDELHAIKKKEGVGWIEIAGAIAASILGATGVVRKWRGPSHKKINIPT